MLYVSKSLSPCSAGSHQPHAPAEQSLRLQDSLLLRGAGQLIHPETQHTMSEQVIE